VSDPRQAHARPPSDTPDVVGQPQASSFKPVVSLWSALSEVPAAPVAWHGFLALLEERSAMLPAEGPPATHAPPGNAAPRWPTWSEQTADAKAGTRARGIEAASGSAGTWLGRDRYRAITEAGLARRQGSAPVSPPVCRPRRSLAPAGGAPRFRDARLLGATLSTLGSSRTIAVTSVRLGR
jgi:hypothetical protein